MINFRKGIYRLWVVVSRFWVAGVVLIASLDGELARGTALTLTIVVVPPLVLLVVIGAVGW
jgi:hypothetical protein